MLFRSASFAVDEQVMVFLWKDREGEWLVLGEAQGKFLLSTDAKTGVRMAENTLKGLCLVVRRDPKDPGGAAAKRADRLSYDGLAAVVRDSVAEAAAATGTTGTAPPAKDGAGQGPAPVKAPDPPATTTPPGGGAPPPTKDAPVPPAGNTDPANTPR